MYPSIGSIDEKFTDQGQFAIFRLDDHVSELNPDNSTYTPSLVTYRSASWRDLGRMIPHTGATNGL